MQWCAYFPNLRWIRHILDEAERSRDLFCDLLRLLSRGVADRELVNLPIIWVSWDEILTMVGTSEALTTDSDAWLVPICWGLWSLRSRGMLDSEEIIAFRRPSVTRRHWHPYLSHADDLKLMKVCLWSWPALYKFTKARFCRATIRVDKTLFDLVVDVPGTRIGRDYVMDWLDGLEVEFFHNTAALVAETTLPAFHNVISA